MLTTFPVCARAYTRKARGGTCIRTVGSHNIHFRLEFPSLRTPLSVFGS